jgi:uncharacterized membrane protein YkvA (DUF1232 family)
MDSNYCFGRRPEWIGEKKMTERKNRNVVVPPQGGMTRDFVNRVKLILKLLGDPRVSPLVKLIPVGALAYLVSPIDIIMGIPGVAALDDAAILWFGSNLFIELCPPEVVQEHMQAIGGTLDNASDDIVDVDATDVNDKR